MTGCLESSRTITPREAEGHVSETVRRKLARHVTQAPPVVKGFTDKSETDEELDRRKKRQKALKSGKVRIADSHVVKRITWPHELVYNSGGEPVMYELI